MLVEIFFPPEGTFCTFEPAFVPYRLAHTPEVPATMIGKALDWTWRCANVVQAADPWFKTDLRSTMVGDVFLVKGEAHAVMPMGFERYEFQQEADGLVLHGRQTDPPIQLHCEAPHVHLQDHAERKEKKRKDRG